MNEYTPGQSIRMLRDYYSLKKRSVYEIVEIAPKGCDTAYPVMVTGTDYDQEIETWVPGTHFELVSEPTRSNMFNLRCSLDQVDYLEAVRLLVEIEDMAGKAIQLLERVK